MPAPANVAASGVPSVDPSSVEAVDPPSGRSLLDRWPPAAPDYLS
jgi:hypothetical protein